MAVYFLEHELCYTIMKAKACSITLQHIENLEGHKGEAMNMAGIIGMIGGMGSHRVGRACTISNTPSKLL